MLRTRIRPSEGQIQRPVGKEILTRTNLLKPSRNKVVASVINLASFRTGLKSEVTTDETHGRPPYKRGGPFLSVKLWNPNYLVTGYSIRGKNITQPNSTTGAFEPGDVWTREYQGALMLSQGFAFQTASLPNEASAGKLHDEATVRYPEDLGALGPRGWSKLRPKVEKAGLAQALIELREAPGMLRSSAVSAKRMWDHLTTLRGLQGNHLGAEAERRRRSIQAARDLRQVPKQVAQEFLNVQFGWKPFVQDIVSMLDVVLNLEEHIQNTTRKNNAWQRRSWAEEVVESSGLVHSEGGLASARFGPYLGPNYIKDWSTNYTVYKESLVEVWYEGVFKYYRPEFDAGLSSGYPEVRRARQTLSLLGGNITPTVLYKVTPWTWLADWFVNIGDNLQLLEDLTSGAVAAKYMYVMRRSYDRYRYVTSSQSHDGKYVSVEATRSLERKQRVQCAGQFRFSLQPTALSGMQYAILAALGLSRT